jgi:hypothetical protein
MKMLTSQQEAHRKEIENLTLTFQAQMTTFKSNIRQNNPKRMEYLEDKMKRTSNQMDARLDKIINLLLINQGNTTGPSPYRKKTRHETTKESNMEIDHFETLTSENNEDKDPELPRNQRPKSPNGTSQTQHEFDLDKNETTIKTPEQDPNQMRQDAPTPPPTVKAPNIASPIRIDPPPALPDSPNQEDAN